MKIKKRIMLIFVLILIVILFSLNFYNKFQKPHKKIIASNDIFESVKIPIVDDMVPQGLAVVDDYILISAYDYNEEKKSVIYVLNKNDELINTCSLDMISHVGGITYDEKNGILWIAGNLGNINAYKITDILFQKKASSFYEFDVGEDLVDFRNEEVNLVSSLTLYKDILYVGSFSLNDTGLMKKYRVNVDNQNIIFEYLESVKIPNKVQGITFYEKNKQEYIFFSISYGRKNLSTIEGYTYNNKINDFTNIESIMTLELPPMLEQITVSDNFMYALYESGATIYSDCEQISEKLTIINMSEF